MWECAGLRLSDGGNWPQPRKIFQSPSVLTNFNDPSEYPQLR
ncbi:hypothetical protein [Lysobacter gummosus]